MHPNSAHWEPKSIFFFWWGAQPLPLVEGTPPPHTLPLGARRSRSFSFTTRTLLPAAEYQEVITWRTEKVPSVESPNTSVFLRCGFGIPHPGAALQNADCRAVPVCTAARRESGTASLADLYYTTADPRRQPVILVHTAHTAFWFHPDDAHSNVNEPSDPLIRRADPCLFVHGPVWYPTFNKLTKTYLWLTIVPLVSN